MARWGTKEPLKKEGRYLITLVTDYGRSVRQADRFKNHTGYWCWSLLPSGVAYEHQVVAWQKCPELYKGE